MGCFATLSMTLWLKDGEGMWTKLFEVSNAYMAETWREVLFSEALSIRVVPDLDDPAAGAMTPRTLYVPDSKTHVAREVLRKL